MTTTNLGKVSVTPKGAYSAETVYERLDLVEHAGSTYIVLKDGVTGVTPASDGQNYHLLAQKGETGTQGAAGAKGDRGEKGEPGKDGAAGAQGAVGPQGQKGERGERGETGAAGPAGPAGPQGAKGETGPRGEPGPKGETGKGLRILGKYESLDALKGAVQAPEAGDVYSVGAAAPYDIYIYDGAASDWVNNGKLQGAKGDRGEKGEPGKDGAAGAQGAVGPQGQKGERGETGAVGPAGPQGAKGETGPRGEPGPKGETGKGLRILGKYESLDALKGAVQAPEAGDVYSVGAAAPYDIYIYDGAASDWVNNGKLQGAQGDRGEKGEPGKDGAAGPAGPQGAKGETGPRGEPGPKGETGKGFRILGKHESLDALKSAVQAPEAGDAYSVGAAAPYDIYIYDGTASDWVNNGKLQGAKGDRGEKGEPGKDGAAGAQGAVGPQGQKGERGERGETGAAGPAGPAGPQGAKGEVGPKGEPGPKGETGKGLCILGKYESLDALKGAVQAPEAGDVYSVGAAAPYDIYIYDGAASDWVNNGKLQGAKGDRGEKGEPGKDGAAGAQGAVGPQGQKGERGETGAAGPAGPAGAKGEKGEPGAAGANGKDGKSAYQTAKEGGFSGEEAAFNAALAGVSGKITDPETKQEGQILVYRDGAWKAETPTPEGVTSFKGRTGAVTPQTGDYTADDVGAVPKTRTVNTKPLSGDITLSAADVGAIAAVNGAQGQFLGFVSENTIGAVDAATGPQGPKGDPGPQGPAGPTGPKGAQGERGEAGPPGAAAPSTASSITLSSISGLSARTVQAGIEELFTFAGDGKRLIEQAIIGKGGTVKGKDFGALAKAICKIAPDCTKTCKVTIYLEVSQQTIREGAILYQTVSGMKGANIELQVLADVVQNSYIFFGGYDMTGSRLYVRSDEFEGGGELNGEDSQILRVTGNGTIRITRN